jgi:hypothetical protein
VKKNNAGAGGEMTSEKLDEMVKSGRGEWKVFYNPDKVENSNPEDFKWVTSRWTEVCMPKDFLPNIILSYVIYRVFKLYAKIAIDRILNAVRIGTWERSENRNKNVLYLIL